MTPHQDTLRGAVAGPKRYRIMFHSLTSGRTVTTCWCDTAEKAKEQAFFFACWHGIQPDHYVPAMQES